MSTGNKLMVCFAFSGLLIIGLEIDTTYNAHHLSEFRRLYPPHTLNNSNITQVPKENFYIAGCTSRYIYLGSYSLPFHLLRFDFSLKDSSSINLPIPIENHLHGKTIKLQVDSPNIYMVDESNTTILSCPISKPDSLRYLTTKIRISSLECKAINPSSFILRNADSSVKSAVLSKLSFNSNPTKIMSRDLLQKQIDGIFDTDGMLHFDHSLNQLVYVYFYRNQYIVMDTNLLVQYRGKTLDSNSKAKISVTYIPSDDETTMSTPPFSVNKLSTVEDGYLFIQSALLAVNENTDAFQDNSAIDVYNLKKQLYEFSFYLPSTANEKMQSFKVSHQKLIVLHGSYLEVYDINLAYLAPG